MMLDTANYQDRDRFDANLIIIGAGPAGITLALQLINRGLSVLLVESGGLEVEDETQSLYKGEVADEKLHSPPDRYRQRRFGGTSTIWGGRCMPFDPIDFLPRDYVAHSGWPLSCEDLDPYYERANLLCEAGPFAYRLDDAFGASGQPMIKGFSGAQFTADRLERFSCPTDFGSRYRHKLAAAKNVRVLLHANLERIELDSSLERIDHCVIRDLRGRSFTVRGDRYVLAAGGLETARLLLANRHQVPGGIGNQHDVVGRYYMCHMAGTMGAITIDRPLQEVNHGYLVSDEGIYCRPRFALTEPAQRSLKVGNFVARLHHPRITDPAHRNAMLSLLFLAKPIIPYEYAKRLHGDAKTSTADWFRHVLNVATGPFDAIGFAWHMVRDRMLADRKFPSIIIKSKANLYSVDFHAEQYPNPSSRVTLSETKDTFGMPQLRVDWRYLPEDVETVRRGFAALKADLVAAGVGDLRYDPDDIEAEVTRYGAYGGHHIGTARMGNDVRDSVVDANCRVHSVSNLYLAGSAVFPTSSQANPTLTLVALALRLADHLQHDGQRH